MGRQKKTHYAKENKAPHGVGGGFKASLGVGHKRLLILSVYKIERIILCI